MPRRILSIGDSHSLYNFAGVRGITVFMKAGCTMHRIARDGVASIIPGQFHVEHTDFVIISCGDVDCRMHVKKQASLKGRSVADEVDDLCDRLANALKSFEAKTGATVAISSMVPLAKHILSSDLSDIMSEAEALNIRNRMNSKLATLGFPFIDFTADFSDDTGFMKPELSDGNVHIDPRLTKSIVDTLNSATGMNVVYKRPPYPVHFFLETKPQKLRRVAKKIMKFPDKHIWRPIRNWVRRAT